MKKEYLEDISGLSCEEMTRAQIQAVKACVDEDRVHDFYISSAWSHLREKIFLHDRRECVIHKAAGKYAKGEIVHHVMHLKEHPDLALCETYVDRDSGKRYRQLITVCRECHETVCHPERMRRSDPKTFRNVERWD